MPIDPVPPSNPTTGPLPPNSSEVTRIHSNSDVDTGVVAQHHTLGIQHNQSSPGDHTHNGKSSKRIGKGLNPSFDSVASATYSQVQIQHIIDALRSLGFGT
jgi:hypothetical protein